MRVVSSAGIGASLLVLAAPVAAQVANICPSTNVCFGLNIPESTASTGDGDIFFSISAPSTYEWVALGQGQGMAGSNMFIVYTASGGSNVTVSPRTASGYSTPTVNSNTQLTLLEGSTVSNGLMTANIRCSNCNSWSGGTMDFMASSGNWIYAYQPSGGPKNSNDQSASIRQHTGHARFTWQFADAKGGNSVNPLISSGTGTSTSGGTTATQSCIPRPSSTIGSVGAASATQTSDDSRDNDGDDDNRGRPSQWGTAWPTARPTDRPSDKRQESLPYCDEVSSGAGSGNTNAGFTPLNSSGSGNRRMMLIAHAVLASLAFVILFPAGAIAIRLASFPGVVWLHAAFQVFAYLVYIAGFGLGVYMAMEMNLLDHYHPIIGIVVLVLVFLQPFLGFLHHVLFKRYGHRTIWSYAHIWIGRIAVTLGIVNGGLGLKLADSMQMSSRAGMIVYGVVAGIMWLAWVAAMFIGERRRKVANANRPPKSTNSPQYGSETGDVSPAAGHDAPQK
ncbi:hypothetical protein ACN47E_009043 [Coniothyrium glycines]